MKAARGLSISVTLFWCYSVGVEQHPPSTLWTARHKGRNVECLVRLLPSGIDVEILIDSTPHIGRTFASSEEALEFSAQQQRKWATEGS